MASNEKINGLGNLSGVPNFRYRACCLNNFLKSNYEHITKAGKRIMETCKSLLPIRDTFPPYSSDLVLEISIKDRSTPTLLTPYLEVYSALWSLTERFLQCKYCLFI